MAEETERARALRNEVELGRKRALVRVASTILDPAPGTGSSDTATILQALDRASEMFTHLARGPMGLSEAGERVRQQLLEASSLLRARIRQDAPIVRTTEQLDDEPDFLDLLTDDQRERIRTDPSRPWPGPPPPDEQLLHNLRPGQRVRDTSSDNRGKGLT